MPFTEGIHSYSESPGERKGTPNFNMPSWYNLRKDGALGAVEQTAAQKSAAHANTPTAMHLDALGRTFLTIVDNGLDGKYSVTLDLDILGKIIATYDNQNRQLIRNVSTQSGAVLRQDDMDSGSRLSISDCDGNLLRSWNSRGFATQYVYDPIRREQNVFIKEGQGTESLVQRNVCSESQPQPEQNNLRTRLY